MSALKIAGISYNCPVCSARVHTPARALRERRACYRFRYPYPEGLCCHFAEEVETAGGLGRLAVEVHSHPDFAS